MDARIELERAYRALQAFYRLAIRNERPSDAMMAYHSLAVGAAIRFVEEGKLDGGSYFQDRPVDVLHAALERARS